jgi:hypothetical protein
MTNILHFKKIINPKGTLGRSWFGIDSKGRRGEKHDQCENYPVRTANAPHGELLIKKSER